jgi:DNA-directed RNA polymerase subunit beta'
VVDSKGVEQKAYNLPVGAHLMVNDGEKIKAGKVLIKIPRKSAKAGDITGGLPRVTELFEARNPSNPAVVTEIDGVVSYGKIKRGNRELIVEAKTGERRNILVKLSNQILVQENDFVELVRHFLTVLLLRMISKNQRSNCCSGILSKRNSGSLPFTRGKN